MSKVLALGLVVVLAGAGFYFYTHQQQPAAVGSAATSTASYTVPPLTQPYTNTAYHFSLTMPADFTAGESSDPEASSTTVVLQNTTGDGIQIVVTPFDEDPNDGTGYTLTKDRILQDVPDLTISNEQPVTVGSNYTGLAFVSDNPAFGGASREVWFVFRGNFYQISTYARLDPLLQAIFKTWQFN